MPHGAAMTGGDDNSDRRRAERVPVNAEFGRLPAPTYVSDLSERGVFVHTDQRVGLGTTLTVRFTVLLDDPVVIEARGRVVRVSDDPAGIGVEFLQLSPDMLLRLGDVITHQRPRELGPPIGSKIGRAAPPPGWPASTMRAPSSGSGDTKVVPAPRPGPQPGDDAFDSNKTLVKLAALDMELLDERDDEEGGA